MEIKWRKMSASSLAGTNKHFYSVFNTLSFAIFEFSTIPWKKKKTRNLRGCCILLNNYFSGCTMKSVDHLCCRWAIRTLPTFFPMEQYPPDLGYLHQCPPAALSQWYAMHGQSFHSQLSSQSVRNYMNDCYWTPYLARLIFGLCSKCCLSHFGSPSKDGHANIQTIWYLPVFKSK